MQSANLILWVSFVLTGKVFASNPADVDLNLDRNLQREQYNTTRASDSNRDTGTGARYFTQCGPLLWTGASRRRNYTKTIIR
ncbi:hypothetical protein scyTo_0007922 [Scyliorhinus torazame]|uniref:Uncharacterized protein n=1 Tax=Scyliorhinus torazame TaxID=75743 RepID=A0A401P0R3_SCYTO|nr:hypothetical protein [Scyliorhinus torazame]